MLMFFIFQGNFIDQFPRTDGSGEIVTQSKSVIQANIVTQPSCVSPANTVTQPGSVTPANTDSTW